MKPYASGDRDDRRGVGMDYNIGGVPRGDYRFSPNFLMGAALTTPARRRTEPAGAI